MTPPSGAEAAVWALIIFAVFLFLLMVLFDRRPK